MVDIAAQPAERRQPVVSGDRDENRWTGKLVSEQAGRRLRSASAEVDPVACPLAGVPGLRFSDPGRNLVAVVIRARHTGEVSGKHRRKWSGLPAGGWGAGFCALRPCLPFFPHDRRR